MSNKISIEQKKGIKRNMLLLSLVFVVIGVVLILSSSDFDMRIIGVIVSVFLSMLGNRNYLL